MLCARIPSLVYKAMAVHVLCVPDEIAFEGSRERSRKGRKVTGAKKWECDIAGGLWGLTSS